LPTEIIGSVRRAFVGLAASEQGRNALVPLKVTGFAAAENADWDDVRALKITTTVGNPDAER
jgi:hypothetical protein